MVHLRIFILILVKAITKVEAQGTELGYFTYFK